MKKIKRFAAVYLIMAILLGLTACGNGEEPAPENTAEPSQSEQESDTQAPPESTSQATESPAPEEIVLTGPAADILNQIVIGWNLGNTLDSFSNAGLGINEGLQSETAWLNPKTSQELIDLVRDNGFNAIRVPVTWYNHMDSNYVIDEEWMDRVQEIVDYVINDDLYCIVNVHHDTGSEGWLRASDTNLEENKVIFASIWEQVSARFADYDEHLMFESFNELLNDKNEWVNPDNRALEVTNELNQLFVDTVRASGGNNPERVLIVNTYCAGGNSQVTKGFVLPTDTVEDSLIVEAHIYQPFDFTAEEFPTATTWSGSSIDTYVNNMYNTFVKQGVPVIIGEFGCVDKDNLDQRISWAQYYMSLCQKYGIKCFWWDNGTAFRLFNRRSLKVAHRDIIGTLVAGAKGEEYALQGEELEEDTDNLCANVDNWTGWVNPEATATISYLADGVSVEVTKGGSEEWCIQPTYTHITLEKGVTYEFSFDYVATKDVTIACNFQQNYDPYFTYVSNSAHFSTEVQHYTTTFTMSEETDDNVALVFNCGKHDKDVPYTMTVTNLSLRKVEE